MTINVTQEDINRGERNKCLLCPVALAIQRASHCTDWAVYPTSVIRWMPSNGRYDPVSLPEEAFLWIRDFDCEEPVQPFSFDLDLPVEDERP